MHFVAFCAKYPQFQFVVSALREALAQERRSAVIKFANGILDTRNEGYTPEQADHILAALKRMRHTPPLYDADITVRLEEPKKK